MVIENSGYRAIREAGWHMPEETWGKLDDYQRDFATNELTGQRTLDYYIHRLEMIGFTDLDCVLDAACGIGQWSVALGTMNRNVYGIDLSEERIQVAKAMVESHGVNGEFCAGPLERLPYEDHVFDAVFCYGAFMFTDMKTVIREFARVLKPGGKLYTNVNTWGWYAHLMIDRGFAKGNLHIVKSAFHMILRTMRGKNNQIVVTESHLRQLLMSAGFEITALDAEGNVRIQNPSIPVLPAYPGSFYGLRSIIEVVGKAGAI